MFDETLRAAQKELEVAKQTGKWKTFKGIIGKIPGIVKGNPKKTAAAAALLMLYGVNDWMDDSDRPPIEVADPNFSSITPAISSGGGGSKDDKTSLTELGVDVGVAGWSYSAFAHPSVKAGLAAYKKTGVVNDALAGALKTAKQGLRPLENMSVKAMKQASEAGIKNKVITDTAKQVAAGQSDETVKALARSKTLKKKIASEPLKVMHAVWKKKGTGWLMKKVAAKKGWAYATWWAARAGIGAAGAVVPEAASSVVGVGMMGWAAYDIVDVLFTMTDVLSNEEVD
jgi:hypothetical protein